MLSWIGVEFSSSSTPIYPNMIDVNPITSKQGLNDFLCEYGRITAGNWMKWKHHLERVVGRGSVGAVEVPLPGGVADVLEVEVDALVAVLGHDGGPAGGAAGGAGRRRPAGDGELPAGDGAAGEALHGHGLHGDGGGEGGHGARTGCCVAHWCPSAYYVHKLNSVDRIVLRILGFVWEVVAASHGAKMPERPIGSVPRGLLWIGLSSSPDSAAS